MIFNLQILRGFAALNVALAHTIFVAGQYNQNTNFLSYLDGWGINGVDIFFVISGFVMLHTQFKKKSSPIEFIKARVVRIVPTYWVVSSLIILLFFINSNLFNNANFDLKLIISSYFFLSNLINNSLPILNVGWTLEFEMFFYIIFALSLNFKNLKTVIIFTTLILILITLFSNQLLFVEFIFGMIIAYAYNKIRLNNNLGLIFLIFGIFLLLISIEPSLRNETSNRLFYWGVPAALIVFGSVYSKQFNNSILLYLGNASYSIYLIHVISISAFYKFFTIFFNIQNTDMLALLCFSSSAIAGCVLYYFIESPLNKFCKKIKNY